MTTTPFSYRNDASVDLNEVCLQVTYLFLNGGAKVQVTGHRSGHRLQATGQVTGHRSQATGQVTGHTKNNRTLDKTVLD